MTDRVADKTGRLQPGKCHVHNMLYCFEYNRSFIRTDRCRYCRSFRIGGLYRGDRGRGNVVQYHLLVVRVSADGDERYDFAGFRTA